jgi:hypothetical protein
VKSDEEAGVGDLSMKVEDKGRECDSGAKYIRVNYRQGFMNLINLMPGNPDGNNWINWSNSSGLTTKTINSKRTKILMLIRCFCPVLVLEKKYVDHV